MYQECAKLNCSKIVITISCNKYMYQLSHNRVVPIQCKRCMWYHHHHHHIKKHIVAMSCLLSNALQNNIQFVKT